MQKTTLRLSFLFLCILIHGTIFAQSDTLQFKKELEHLKFQNLKERLLEYRYTNEVYANILIRKIKSDICESKYDSLHTLKAYQQIYSWQLRINDLYTAFFYADLARNMAIDIKDTHAEVLAINTIAFVNNSLGDHDIALKHYFMALSKAKKSENKYMELAIRVNIAKVLIEGRNAKEAIKDLERILDELKSSEGDKYKHFFPTIYSFLTEAYILQENAQKARQYNNLYEDIASELYSYGQNPLNEAAIEVLDGNYNKAIEILDQVAKVTDTMKVQPVHSGTALLHLIRGKAHFLNQDYHEAIEDLTTLRTLLENNTFNDIDYQEGFALLAESFSAIERLDSSMVYYKKSLDAYTQNEKKRLKVISEIANEYNDVDFEEELQKRNLISSKEMYTNYMAIKKKLNLLTLETSQTNKYTFIWGLLVSLMLVGLSIWIYTSKKRNYRKFDSILKELKDKKSSTKPSKPVHIDLKKETVDQIIKGLEKLKAKKFFLRTDCTSETLAKKLKSNKTYLSKVVYLEYGLNFNTYLNEMRIEYAIEKLKNDAVFRSYSIASISKELGYKTPGSFVKNFKKKTGILPSYFIKRINNLEAA